jgi:hypothetical protein
VPLKLAVTVHADRNILPFFDAVLLGKDGAMAHHSLTTVLAAASFAAPPPPALLLAAAVVLVVGCFLLSMYTLSGTLSEIASFALFQPSSHTHCV